MSNSRAARSRTSLSGVAPGLSRCAVISTPADGQRVTASTSRPSAEGKCRRVRVASLSQCAQGLAGLAHAFAVRGVRLGAVLDVLLDGFGSGALDGASGVVEQPLLLVAGH